MSYYLAALFLFLSPIGANDATEQVIRAEKDFAQTSRDKGKVFAFLNWLADDAILFNPKPVKGKPLYENRKKSNSELWWQPGYVVTAASGDLGMSTGPSVSRSSTRDPHYGHFLTVWQKQADGSWKVAIDHGIGHAPFEEKDWPKEVETGLAPAVDPNPSRTDLQARDLAYAKAASEKGWAGAFADFAAAEVRLYRNGSQPVIGRDKALAVIVSDGPATWRPLGGKTASSGEFGFTYGQGNFLADGPHFVYLRIWRAPRGGEFRLLVELVRNLKG